MSFHCKQIIYRYRKESYGERIMQAIENAATTIKEIWDYQHPVMHTWFVWSSLSLCAMFALLYFAI